MVIKTLSTLAAKRIPLIKFRKGGSIASSIISPSSTSISTGSKVVVSAPAIEDWQLPAKYKRRPLDPIEIDYINRGGPP